MEQTVIETVNLAGSAPTDLSMWGLFLRADLVVKAVLVVLLVASFWCWAIIFEKLTKVRRIGRKTAQFEDTFWSGNPLDELYQRLAGQAVDPMAAMFTAAMRELERSSQRGLTLTETKRIGIQQRIDRAMQATMSREMDKLERHMTFLASVGATAPFIGLFGTVWGIMNSFQAIALQKNTSLAVVAPGIAEALFATALGLVAAIPAVIAFNKINNDLSRYASRLETFAGEFAAILGRQLEERSV
ncbi:MAG: protein TolQ [Alphaproteobacteria bacterium]|nr:protein TolQ [Alphaproteobacteria bacterium]